MSADPNPRSEVAVESLVVVALLTVEDGEAVGLVVSSQTSGAIVKTPSSSVYTSGCSLALKIFT